MTRFALFATAALVLTACGEPPEVVATPGRATLPAQAAAGLPTLDADGLPRFRAGLWEVVTTDDASDEEPATSRQCLGDKANADLRDALRAGDTPNCRRTRSVSVAGLTIKASCAEGGVRTDVTIRLAGHDTAYTLTMDLASTMPDGTAQRGRIEGRARWLGLCPAGMEPGDEIADSANL